MNSLGPVEMHTFHLEWRKFRFDSDSSCLLSLYAVFLANEYGFLLNALSKDDVVIDAGANIGAFAIPASIRAKKVFAVEPHPSNYNFLKKNISQNCVHNITPINAAFSDRMGSGFLNGEGEGAHLDQFGLPVDTITFDSLLDNSPTVLKIDIEGTEIRALKALKSWSHIRAIAVETHNTYQETKEILVGAGYALREYRTTRLMLLKNAITIAGDRIVPRWDCVESPPMTAGS